MAKATEGGREPQQFMVGSILAMSWQLALAVLVPLLGGHALDRAFGTLPWLTLTGLIMAMIGMVVVVRRSINDLNEYMRQNERIRPNNE